MSLQRMENSFQRSQEPGKICRDLTVKATSLSCVCVRVYVYVHVYVYVYMYVYVCVSVYVCMCMCLCMYRVRHNYGNRSVGLQKPQFILIHDEAVWTIY
uniref:Ovule protein n=1 Tax=Haemonchus contortus TaxID=6289 RepID=A0A7I4XVH1_HAECO